MLPLKLMLDQQHLLVVHMDNLGLIKLLGAKRLLVPEAQVNVCNAVMKYLKRLALRTLRLVKQMQRQNHEKLSVGKRQTLG
ncbi:uncharacterized protein LOC106773131 isoform X3 [Vigna radiata var. radiata]|uniref:Uncharacterized protein LOC106773131 isoform X3 n=1 Tax=Vigna radiata var. radiata TaxID=3916 RepID=A0A3Q0F5B6_VIGRR|nr:uncharacterized protein LOC106773131 isoform X3 [Vigna radiata var. radiata]